MSQYNYQNEYYYTLNTSFNVNGIVGVGSSAIEAALDKFLEEGKGTNVTKSLRFLTKFGIASTAVSTAVDVIFNGETVTIGKVVIDLAGGFAVEALITEALLAAGLTSSLGFVIGVGIGSTLIWSGVQAIGTEINTEVNAFLDDITQGSLVDLKFVNSSGEHVSGIMIPSETYNVLGIKGSIMAYLSNTTEDAVGGYLTFADGRDGDQVNGIKYKIFNGSAFQTIANELEISLDKFLAVGVGAVKNADIYIQGFNKIAFAQDVASSSNNASSKIYIPIVINGVAQVIAVDAVYNESEASNNLVLGRMFEVILGTSQTTYPDSLIFSSNSSTPIIINTGRSEGNVEGNQIIIGSNNNDNITVYKSAIIDGGDGIDTMDYSSLGFGSGGISVDLINHTATNGISLGGAFHNTLYNIENVVGSAGDDSIIGNNSNNTIYGNAGDDTLSGGSGSDSLYGGNDDDTLNGDAGNDTLNGNFGDDTLNGGSGNDFLYDSSGFDTYNFSGSFGIDLVNDSDKSGKIVIDGKEITGTANYIKSVGRTSPNDIYRIQLGDKVYDLVQSGSNLLITEANSGNRDNCVIIKNFSSEDFNISLQGGGDNSGGEDNSSITDPKELLPNFKNYFKDWLDDKVDDAHSISSTLTSSLTSLYNSSLVRRVDPLSLDLDGDGIELVNVASSTAFFDLDVVANTDASGNFDGTYTSDGVKEQVGWISGDDGILTLDKNNNGAVDNILELFGKTNKTGTEELREYDLNNAVGQDGAAVSNGIADGVIDSKDAIFSQLRVWQDVNQDGISQSDELKSLADLNITSINVAPESLTTLNQNNQGNLVLSQGSFTKSDGTTGTYSNLDLAVNQTNSSSYTYTDGDGNVVGDYDLNLDVLSLPMIRGYGDIKALPIAASSGVDDKFLAEITFSN